MRTKLNLGPVVEGGDAYQANSACALLPPSVLLPGTGIAKIFFGQKACCRRKINGASVERETEYLDPKLPCNLNNHKTNSPLARSVQVPPEHVALKAAASNEGNE